MGVLEPPESSSLRPLELKGNVEEGEGGIPPLGETGVFVNETSPLLCGELVGEGVLERETTDGVWGTASGSLPAACASPGSNPLFYTQSIRHAEDPPVKCAYGSIQIRPMRDRGVERNAGGVSGRDDEPLNLDEKAGFMN